jgi:hypothetical protein
VIARALTVAAGLVLLAIAGIAFLACLVVLIPGGETDADTWLGTAILLGAALLVGGVADLLIIRGMRPAPRAAVLGEPSRRGVDYGSAVGPALHEVGFQLFGVVGGIMADLLTAFLQRRRRTCDQTASPATTDRRGWVAQVRAGLWKAAAVALLMLWVGAIGGLEGVVEGFVNAPATTWKALTTGPAFQVALGVCVGVTVVGTLILSRLRRE